jgi:hypothetical protein
MRKYLLAALVAAFPAAAWGQAPPTAVLGPAWLPPVRLSPMTLNPNTIDWSFVLGYNPATGLYAPLTFDSTGLNLNVAVAGGAVTAAPPALTPSAATASAIVSGGNATTFVTGPVNGGYICNPLLATDQNIATAETLYLNPVTTATANGRGTNSALAPGAPCYTVPPLKAGSNISAIAATTLHAANVVVW